MPKSSKELRAKIVSDLMEHAGNNPDDYNAYMVACSIGWYFRDSPTGMATVNQLNLTEALHKMISTLAQADDNHSPALTSAHITIHDLRDYLIQKLKDKGYISADDHELEDDGLIDEHADDFEAWLQEIDATTGEDKDK